ASVSGLIGTSMPCQMSISAGKEAISTCGGTASTALLALRRAAVAASSSTTGTKRGHAMGDFIALASREEDGQTIQLSCERAPEVPTKEQRPASRRTGEKNPPLYP